MSKELPTKILNSIDRIISGVFYATFQGDLYSVRPAPLSLRQRAALHYERIIRSAKFEAAFSQAKFLDICVRRGVLDKDFNKNLEKSQKDIDKLKIKLFDSWGREEIMRRTRKELELAKRAYIKQYNYLEKLKLHTLEGIAEHAKSEFIFLHSIYDSEGNKVFDNDIEDIRIYNNIHSKYGRAMLSDSEVRILSRSSAWRHLWSYKKHEVFENGVATLMPEQKLVLHFSEMYDFAYGHDKPVPDSLIEDDDRFDGWYLKEVQRLKDERKKNADRDDNADAGEIYKLVDNQEAAQEVYDLNTTEGQRIIRERNKLLAEKGSATDIDFPDVRQDIAMKSQRQAATTIKRTTK